MIAGRPVQPVRGESKYQAIAIALCVALGLAMIVNTQLGGEGMWFWYTTLFQQGSRLYADLHTPLQPYFVLESDLWMRVLGRRCIPIEIASLCRVFALAFGYLLALRECRWSDARKAVVLFSGFVLTVVGNSYRFDDYHVVAEIFILYSLVLLLRLARARTQRRELLLTLGLGVFCGLTITTRVTDGAALLVAVAFSVLVLAKQRRLLLLGTFVLVTAGVLLAVVKSTGDTYHAWLYTTVIRAAGSKGGTGSIFLAPVLFFRNALALMRVSGKTVLLSCLGLFAFGAAISRFFRRGLHLLLPMQLVLATVVFAVLPALARQQAVYGGLMWVVTLFLTILTYVLAPVIAARLIFALLGRAPANWDVREILLAVPLAEWASYSAGAAAEPHTGYYAPIAIFLLLVAIVEPFGRYAPWASPSLLSLLILLAVTGSAFKVRFPYYWQNYSSAPMFHNREWYRHPVYGPLYIDRDLLAFSEAVCRDIDQQGSKPELLSMPYPFPNYFCDTPPWHGYVQTMFDTSTSSTIHDLEAELDTAPPQFIVYQRQLHILAGAERLYNHGQPLPQRRLDTMMMNKVATGQWTLIEKRQYLEGDGWYILQTHP